MVEKNLREWLKMSNTSTLKARDDLYDFIQNLDKEKLIEILTTEVDENRLIEIMNNCRGLEYE